MAAQPVSYHFVSHWQIAAPIEQVWEALVNPNSWTEWWPGLEKSGQTDSGRADFIWRAPSGYRLHLCTAVTSSSPYRRLDFTAAGDLVGKGSCELLQDSTVQVIITWDVATIKPWMNRFAWLLRPLYALNHRQLMAAGETGLRRYLTP